MIEFLVTNWWIYIPIILVLLVLNVRTNRKVREVRLKRANQEADPEKRREQLDALKRRPSKVKSKLGVRGIGSYIFPKK